MKKFDGNDRHKTAISPETPERFLNHHGPVKVYVKRGCKLETPEIIDITVPPEPTFMGYPVAQKGNS